MAGVWIRRFLPAFRDRLEVADLVDINRAVLDQMGDFLGVDPSHRFTEMENAFAQTEADFCILVIPPVFNKRAISLAVGRRMPILVEKPLADSWQACMDIYRMVKGAGLKLAVVQNYRFTKPIMTLKRVLEEGSLGPVYYITSRFAVNHLRNTGGSFRYQVPDIMLYEGSVHHFDQLRNLSATDCSWITGKAWNPPGSGFDTDCCGLFVMGMNNGVKCEYETSYVAAGAQNDWHREYYRVECERGSAVLDRDGIVRTVEHISSGRTRLSEPEPVTAEYSGNHELEGHHWIIQQFLDWLDGGPPPATALDDNLKTAALTFAAVDASSEVRVINVNAKLQSAGVESPRSSHT